MLHERRAMVCVITHGSRKFSEWYLDPTIFGEAGVYADDATATSGGPNYPRAAVEAARSTFEFS